MLEVPPRHRVREGVVIDVLVILVRPDDAVDVSVTVAIDTDPRGPVAGCLATTSRQPGSIFGFPLQAW